MIPLPSEQPTIPLWPDAGQALGIKSRSTAYRVAHAGKLPVRVLEVGVKLVVPTVELRRVLGLDEQPATAEQAVS